MIQLPFPSRRPARFSAASAARRLAWTGALAAIALFPAPPRALAAEALATFATHKEGSAATVDHGAWSRLLATYVAPDAEGIARVRYARFKAEGRGALKTYLATLEAVDPRTLDKPEQFAFWANLYNAKTVDIVLDAYPVASIRDINLGGGLLAAFSGGPWKAKVLTVAGVTLSLDDIEHGILRPIFQDPRIHYAVNCASYGCPNLPAEAFTGARIEAQLDAAARAYVNHPRGVTVAAGGDVQVSSIYRWYAADFGGDAAGVLAHLRRYAAPGLARRLEGAASIASYVYDWRLNDSQ